MTVMNPLGGCVAIDFQDPASPVVRKVRYDFGASGHALCIVDTASSHADLTDDYAAIPQEMGAVAAHFGKKFLRDVPEGKYDLMIVDPPAFAKHRGALKNALRAYQRLNAAAIAKVAPGGFVFTFSCSQVVDKEAFALAVFSAAAQTGRSVRILDRLNQPADHAVNIYHPEGEYLKGLLLYVE